ncbi:hypothetical protein B4Q13_16805 [Lacticaseibacillus rhamnosus]
MPIMHSPFDPAYDASLPQRHQDIAQAKSLLKAAGLKLEEVLDQQRDVFLPLAQRRHDERYDGEPVVQIRAKPTGARVGFEIGRGELVPLLGMTSGSRAGSADWNPA